MKRILAFAALAFLLAIATALQKSGAQETKLNLRDYYPLADGNTWTYQVKQYRADGQIAYRLRTQFIAGEAKPEPGVTAKRLMDDRGRYSLVAADDRSLRVFGENAGQGEVKIAPAYTLFEVDYKPGKVYTARHTPSEGEAVTGETAFFGVESVNTPAGAFRDCLKLRFQTTKPSGATMTTTSYLAKGVGLVKEVQEVFSPAAGQSLRYETELMHCTLAGRKIGGEAARTVQVAEYFP
ncbi:MAG: TapB family protein, partial [Blastocatellia bacterium]